MRKNFGAKPFLYPMPVLIIASYDEDGIANAMNAAWGCIADTDRIAIYVAGNHKTMANILSRKAFTVSMANVSNTVPADYVGIVSGKNVPDKMKKAGWHTVHSEFVDAPLIKELPLALECELISFDEETESLVGRIVNVSADESILTAENIDPVKLNPIMYDPVNHRYYSLGEMSGNAFSDGKKLM